MASFVFILWLVSDGFASGNYQQKTYSTPAPGPQVRDAKTIERDILGWERRSVAIYSVRAVGEKFVVTGAYTHKSDFDRFLKKLKGEEGGPLREVSTKETSTSFGGSTSYNFEAEVENAW